MGTVKAVYVGQAENGTVFLGDFSSELENVHAGADVEVTVTPVEHPDAAAEANGNGTTAEPTEGTATEQPAQ